MTKEEIINTNPINNKEIQSNKKVIIIELPFKVMTFQSIKYTKSLIRKVTPKKQHSQPDKNKKINLIKQIDIYTI